MRKLSNIGDTIVEVLIAMTVISMVLGGAFASANRSLSATQSAKERDQGIRLAETQLEQLKSSIRAGSMWTEINNDLNDFFCIRSLSFVDITQTIPTAMDTDLLATPTNYPPDCVLDSGNNPHSATSRSIPYYVSIEQDNSDDNLFTVLVRWERAGSAGREQAAFKYRTYEQ